MSPLLNWDISDISPINIIEIWLTTVITCNNHPSWWNSPSPEPGFKTRMLYLGVEQKMVALHHFSLGFPGFKNDKYSFDVKPPICYQISTYLPLLSRTYPQHDTAYSIYHVIYCCFISYHIISYLIIIYTYMHTS